MKSLRFTCCAPLLCVPCSARNRPLSKRYNDLEVAHEAYRPIGTSIRYPQTCYVPSRVLWTHCNTAAAKVRPVGVQSLAHDG